MPAQKRVFRAAFGLTVFALFEAAQLARGSDLQGGAEPTSAEIGKRMYREGLLPSSAPMVAKVQGDVELPGSLATCISCHQRSGLGSSEGDIIALPVTGAALYEPRVRSHEGHFGARLEGPGTRPAYTDEALARAIREGVDSRGRALDPMMPRYDLREGEISHLIAYLKTLSSTPPPGVTESEIHLATVVAGDVSPAESKALVDALNAFFAAKNAESRHEERRAERPPWHKEWKYSAYRKWVLHVWTFTGPTDTWRSQLEALYHEQPVFAILSGISAGEWRPIHRFCENFEIPCLLPTTELPVVSESDFYSIYFSEGLALEAKALAKYLVDSDPSPVAGRIVQVYRNDRSGETAASAFRQALLRSQITGIGERRIEPFEKIDGAFWRALITRESPDALVLWLPADDLTSLEQLADSPGPLSSIFLSSSLVPDYRDTVPRQLWNRMFIVHSFALPEESLRKTRLAKRWLQRQGVDITNERIQLNAFFSARVLGDALMHMVGNFSRDYLIEKIQHRITGTVTPSLYPNVSLAPGQHFLSKGSYIVKPSESAEGGVVAVSTWIVP